MGSLLTSNSATLKTDTTGSGNGLHQADNFTVSAEFDLTLPNDIGEGYGIRLSDKQSNTLIGDPATATMCLGTVRSQGRLDGVVAVQFRDLDFVAGTSTNLQSIGFDTFALANATNIVLHLTHAANSTAVTASYELLNSNGAVLQSSVFNSSAAGTIFSDETWTRAQLVATSSTTDPTYYQGTYGALTVDPSGNWTYQTQNNSTAVKALAAGEIAHDTFTVQVTDDQGTSTTTPATFTVTGVNDAPTLNLNGGNPVVLNYTENDPGTPIAASATLGDINSAKLNGGSLRISLGLTGHSDDQITIAEQGTDPGQIHADGTNVYYGNVVIGTYVVATMATTC